MEREIKELMAQRDLAQSRLDDLLHAVVDEQSRQWVGAFLCSEDCSVVAFICLILVLLLSLGRIESGIVLPYAR